MAVTLYRQVGKGKAPVIHREVEEEAEAVVVRPQRLLALALLVFALKQLKLSEPLIRRR